VIAKISMVKLEGRRPFQLSYNGKLSVGVVVIDGCTPHFWIVSKVVSHKSEYFPYIKL
jgi:hypothetical protein